MSKPSLDGFDWQLLELLQQQGRMTISEMAKQLSRSRSSISERLEKLQDMGVISGVVVQVDEQKLGFGISAFVRLQADSSRHREIIGTITQLPEVAECHVLTGDQLLIFRVVARDMPHLRELVDGFTQYGATSTDVIFSTVKERLVINRGLQNSAR